MAAKANTPRIVSRRYETVPMDCIRPHPDNYNEGDAGVVIESIDTNGFYGDVYVQESTGLIVAGHTRWYSMLRAYDAAQTPQRERVVPVCFLNIDDATARRILAVDNKSRDKAHTDMAAFDALLGKIYDESGTLKGTGLDGDEWDEMQADLERPIFNSGSGKGHRGSDDPPDGQGGSQEGQGGPANPDEGEEAPEESGPIPAGLRRISISLLHEADHALCMRAIDRAQERAGLTGITHHVSGPSYNMATRALLAICAAYLDTVSEASELEEVTP